MAPSSGSAAPTAKHTYLTITAAPTQLKTVGNFIAKQIALWQMPSKLWRSQFLSLDCSISNVKDQQLHGGAQPACLPSARWEPCTLPWSCLHHSNASCPQTGLKISFTSCIFCGGNPLHMDAASRYVISAERREAIERMLGFSLSAVKRWSTLQFRNLYTYTSRFPSCEFTCCVTL